MTRTRYVWELARRRLELGARTLIMGVLNVTPDSFSDGGQFLSRDHAVGRALQMLEEGADILDIGGESTRPGAKTGDKRLSPEEELARVLPVIEDVLRERPDAIVSVDTYKSAVAQASIAAGAEIVNDVSALRWDSPMAAIIAELKCGVILMHSRGRPEEWLRLPPSPDIIAEVKKDLREWSAIALDKSIGRGHIVLDPGFGFGKSLEQNYPLLAGFEKLHDLGFPLLSGTSRKTFIGRTLARNGQDAPVDQRLYGTLA